MPTTVNDILRGIGKTINVPNKSFTCNNVSGREPRVIAVKYFFDIIDMSGPVPYETIIANIRRNYPQSELDNYLPYQIDSVDDGVDLCRQFCQSIGLNFTANDEQVLRNKTESENVYLLIIEREIFEY